VCIKIFFFFILITISLYGISQERDTSINLYFALNDSELDATQLQKFENFLASFPSIKHITGFADSTGSSAYNLILSKKRALSVSHFMRRDYGLNSEDSISFHGESKEYPDPWMNRRVQVTAKFTTPLVIAPGPVKRRPDTMSNIYLDHVYFIPDKPIITYESLSSIQELARNLKAYTSERFEIIGHINYQSRFDSTHLTDLYRLSELRAKAVYESLIESGIPKSRMTYKGVGNAQPVYPSPENDDQRKKNMRVQVIIIK
jgi:outer membrane protein OmpA-like peptidoglycan-associated protein